MSSLSGPLLIVGVVLAAGGAAKATRPLPTRRALYAMGLPSHSVLVRALGLFEVVVAVATIVVGGRLWPAVTGTLYLSFALFVVAALRNGAVSSCGCFGRAGTPPSRLHVVLNVAAAGVAFAAIGTPDLAATVADQPAAGVPFLALAAIGSYAALLAYTVMPLLQVRSR